MIKYPHWEGSKINILTKRGSMIKYPHWEDSKINILTKRGSMIKYPHWEGSKINILTKRGSMIKYPHWEGSKINILTCLHGKDDDGGGENPGRVFTGHLQRRQGPVVQLGEDPQRAAGVTPAQGLRRHYHMTSSTDRYGKLVRSSYRSTH